MGSRNSLSVLRDMLGRDDETFISEEVEEVEDGGEKEGGDG